MANFSINILDLKQCIADYKDYNKNCIQDVKDIYKNLDNISENNYWNDNNSIIFNKKKVIDKEIIIQYYEYLYSLFKEYETISNDLIFLYKKYDKPKSFFEISFSDENSIIILNYLYNAEYYVNDAIYQLSLSTYGYSNYYVNILRNELSEIKDLIVKIKNNLSNLFSDVLEKIENSKLRVSSLENRIFELVKLDYSWKLYDYKLKNQD